MTSQGPGAASPAGRVEIREVGPRDGLQLEPPISLPAKLRLLDALVATGVRRIEATAFVSPKAVPAMADAAEVARELRRWPQVEWSALVPNLKGAELAVAAGITRLEYVVSAADGHSRANTRQSTMDALGQVRPVAEVVHAAGGTLEVIVATAWDCPFDGPTPVASCTRLVETAVTSGADEICLADTIGTVVPGRVSELVESVRAVVNVPLGAHFHNTRGTGLASAWQAVLAGVTRLDASVGGLGGCPFAPGATGNIATDELVYLLEGSGYETGIDLDRALEAARLVEELVGHPADSHLLKAGGPPQPQRAGARPAEKGLPLEEGHAHPRTIEEPGAQGGRRSTTHTVGQ